MSYDICLCNDQGIVTVKRHEEGGTYRLGGTDEAWLNVTYNYSKHFHDHLDENNGIRWLYGKTGAQCISRLEQAVNTLGRDADPDYWAPTEGNARKALMTLLSWARQHPIAVFEGD